MNDPRPAHFPWLTPYLMVRDCDRSTTFYSRAFGFTLQDEIKKFGYLVHVKMAYRGELVLMFSPEGTFGSAERPPASLGVPASQVFYLYVADVDTTYQRALDAGAKSLTEPANMFWGDRLAMVEDPDGYRWALAYHFTAHD